MKKSENKNTNNTQKNTTNSVENYSRRASLIDKTDNPMRMAEMASIVTDPFGSYTGVPSDPNEKPVQDVDDL